MLHLNHDIPIILRIITPQERFYYYKDDHFTLLCNLYNISLWDQKLITLPLFMIVISIIHLPFFVPYYPSKLIKPCTRLLLYFYIIHTSPKPPWDLRLYLKQKQRLFMFFVYWHLHYPDSIHHSKRPKSRIFPWPLFVPWGWGLRNRKSFTYYSKILLWKWKKIFMMPYPGIISSQASIIL